MMEAFMAEVLPSLVVLAGSVVAGLVLIARAGLRDWFAARVQNEMIRTATAKVADAVWHVVGELNQTMVEEAKARSRDGKLTKADRDAIMTAAVRRVKRMIGGEWAGLADVLGWSTAGGATSDAETNLRSRIEAAVLDRKVELRPFVGVPSSTYEPGEGA